MIKKGNNIRFGNKIFVVEGIDNDSFLLRNKESNVINWVSKKSFFNNLEKMNFKYDSLNESLGQKPLVFKNDYLIVELIEEGNNTKVTITTDEELYEKYYQCSKSKALYEFNKYFTHSNQLTPYKLAKTGFKKCTR